MVCENVDIGECEVVKVCMVVNVVGLWVGDMIWNVVWINSFEIVWLVCGSYIVIKCLYDYNKVYFF